MKNPNHEPTHPTWGNLAVKGAWCVLLVDALALTALWGAAKLGLFILD